MRFANQTLALLGAEQGTRLGGTEGPDLTRYLLVCALLLLAIVGLAWGFRRFVGRSLSLKAAKRSMQVMDVLPLGGKHKLAVVRCYDRTFLLGLGEKEVSKVAELDAVIAPEEVPGPEEPDRRAFADLLSRVRGPAGAPPQPETRPEPGQRASRGLGAGGVLG